MTPISDIVNIHEYKNIGKYKDCIYCIKNIINNKIYIGQAGDFLSRFTNHVSELKNNKHGNIYLQSSYLKYGYSAFVVFIIEENVERDDLYLFERFYIHKFKLLDRKYGYNLTDVNIIAKPLSNKSTLINFSRKTKKLFKQIKATNIIDNAVYIFDSMVEATDFVKSITPTNFSKDDTIRSMIRQDARGLYQKKRNSKYSVNPPFGYKWEFIN